MKDWTRWRVLRKRAKNEGLSSQSDDRGEKEERRELKSLQREGRRGEGAMECPLQERRKGRSNGKDTRRTEIENDTENLDKMIRER